MMMQRPKIVRRFSKNEQGATAVEFAFIAGPFFFLIFAIIESCIYFMATQYLESSVDSVGRSVRTGQIDSTATEAEFKQAICDAASQLFDCDKLQVDLSVAATFDDLKKPPEADDEGAYDATSFGFTPPDAEQIIQITAVYEWPILTNYAAPLATNSSNTWALIMATAVFRSEPYK